MPLPILHALEPSADDLVRLFHRTELHWSRHLADETPLEFGVAFANRQLAHVPDANRVLDVALPEGVSPEQVLAAVENHFQQAGAVCRSVVLNPSGDPAQAGPMALYLRQQGWMALACDVLRLVHLPPLMISEIRGLRVIPARASFRHVCALAGEMGVSADVAMAHLDDPHWDMLLAMKDAQAVAQIGVMSEGDLGVIRQLYVTPAYRRQGVGRLMLGRILDLCACATFKRILAGVDPADAASLALYQSFGFAAVGKLVAYESKTN